MQEISKRPLLLRFMIRSQSLALFEVSLEGSLPLMKIAEYQYWLDDGEESTLWEKAYLSDPQVSSH